MRTTRRSFLLLGAAAGAYAATSRLGLARADDARPHFLLSVQVSGGMDPTYLFDARGPRLTNANLQQNYLLRNDAAPNSTTPDAFTDDAVRARTMTTERTGSTALRSPIVEDLWSAHQDCLSIVNGVVMLPDNASHDANSAYLLGSASGAGGAAIYPPMVGKRLGGTPLEAVILRETWLFSPPPSNLAGSADLSPDEVGAIAATLTNGPSIDESSPTWKHIVARADANAAGTGLFAEGAQNLGQSLRRAKATASAFAAAGGSSGRSGQPLVDDARSALSFFSGGVTRVATIIYAAPVDTHDRVSAQKQPDLFADVAGQLLELIKLLKTTMYVEPNGRSTPFIELTTFVISSEFGRSTRALAFAGSVGNTGTDHNTFTNSALVGGRGIVPGLVVGESDLRDCDDAGNYLDVSGAHRRKNPSLDLAMGKPFDFAAQRVRTDLPDQFSASDYICMPSVTNTILDCFGVPQGDQLKLGTVPAPVLTALRSAR